MDNKSDLLDMCLDDGVQLRRSGGRAYIARCPFHHDTKASFRIQLNNRGYWVFKCWSTACDVRGGAKRYRELTNRPPAPFPDSPTSQKPDRFIPPTPELIDLAVNHYAEQLPLNQEALHYLQQRGVTPQMATRWRLGFVPQDSLYRILRTQMDDEQLDQCPIIRHRRSRDRYIRRIIIPRTAADGSSTWFTARAIDPDREPKYLHLPGSRPSLMRIGDHLPNRNRYQIITEGPFDAITLNIAGYPAQCTNGNPYEERLANEIRQQKIRRVYILPDRDEGGAGWAGSVGRAVVQAGSIPILLSLPPPFNDPGEIIAQQEYAPTSIISTLVRTGIVRYPNGWTPPPPPPNSQQNADPTQKETSEMPFPNGDPITFFGNLTRDPEPHQTRNGGPMATFAVASNNSAWDSQEEKYVETTVFYDCIAFGVIAKQIIENLGKGDFGWFGGPMIFKQFERRDGSPGYSHNITVDRAHLYLQMVKRDRKSSDDDRDRGRDRDRDRDRNRDSDRGRDSDQDRDREHQRPRSDDRRGTTRNDDDDRRGNARNEDDDRRGSARNEDEDRRDSARNDEDRRGSARNEDEDRRGSARNDDERDASRHGNWTPESGNVNPDDLPF